MAKIEHNTAFQRGNVVFAEGRPHTGFVFRNNVILHNETGITGTGTGVGHPTLAAFFPGAIVKRNVIVAGPASLYPADNFFPVSPEQVGFADRARGVYRLTTTSRYRGAGTDGRDPGADFEALAAAMPRSATAGAAQARR